MAEAILSFGGDDRPDKLKASARNPEQTVGYNGSPHRHGRCLEKNMHRGGVTGHCVPDPHQGAL